MNSDEDRSDQAAEQIVLIEDDFEAAREAINAMKDITEPGADDGRLLDFLAKQHARIGSSDFQLSHGLRPHRNQQERLTLDVRCGRISDAEFIELMKKEEDRPLDQETVQSLFERQEEFLVYYGRMLQTIIAIVHDQRNPDSWITQEPKVDRYVREMDAKINLSPRQLERIIEFLEEVRVDRGLGQAQIGEHRAATVSSLVFRVLNHAREGWNSCREIAERSRNDPEYLYETTASVLFFDSHYPSLPRPNDVSAALREESAAARLALKERDLTPVPPSELRQTMEDPQEKKDLQDFSGETITDPIRLSISEVAKFIGVSDRTIRDWRTKGKLTAVDDRSGQLVFSKSTLEILRESRK